jgi:hypothetical protein
MIGHGTSFFQALSVATKTFFRTWGNPEQQHALKEHEVRAYRYARLWDLYQGTAFEDLEAWAEYRRAFALYRQIRLIWDHVHSLVEFYATHVWSGSLADDGLKLPDGVPNAIPLAEDTDTSLAAAIGQLWKWWNFQEVMTMLVRYTAALGEMLVEIKDDPDRGKVLIDLVWPSYVKDIRLDEAGNVTYYCIEYQVWDEQRNDYYIYKREVDKQSFRTFKNGQPFDYTADSSDPSPATATTAASSGLSETFLPGEGGAAIPNPYGFVPAVLFRHIRTLGVHGEPAVWATQSELDEVNALFSHIIDKSHVSLRAPIVVAGNIAPNSLQRALNNMVGAVKRTFTEDLDDPYADREELNILEGPAGTQVSTIELKITDATTVLDRVIAGIERKTPEVTFYEQLRAMTQLTGPAASRLLGDVEHRVRSISAGYDNNLVKLLQMGVAVAGWRVNSGDWDYTVTGEPQPDDAFEAVDGRAREALTVAQKLFTGFDLDSYARGDLDFDIMPRDLVPMTSRERYELLQMKRNVLPFIPDVQLAKEGGYEEADAEKWVKEYEAKQLKMQEREFQQQQQLAIKRPTGAPPGGPQKGSANQNRRPAKQNNLRAVK